MQNLSKQIIKGYELREPLGTGGFGAVYKAFQSAVGRDVAIKIILPALANQSEFIRRFETEAQVIARLEHPSIVPLYDYWREPDGAYLVMRWLRGGSLSDLLKRGPLDLETIARILDQVSAALTLAHRNGIVHRDIKPGNILLDEDSNAYLADFGIAKDLQQADGGGTQMDAIVGSLDYISPEQARSEPVTSRTDIYSLGVVLYEMLTGEHPFPNMSSVERLYKHINDALPNIANLEDTIRDNVNNVVQKATAKNPLQRYESATEFVSAFKEAAGLNRAPTSDTVIELLRQREHEVLSLMVAGLSNKEIAAKLVVTVATVKWYTNEIFRKLRVRTRVQAIIRARELNLIVPGGSVSEETLSPSAGIDHLPEPENPYKGLQAFQAADERDFFGREDFVQKLLKRLTSSHNLTKQFEEGRFLAVVGPSGSGKSSVIKAGLIPAVLRGGVPGSERWFVVEIVPGARPYDELEVALLKISPPHVQIHDQLRRDEYGLLRVSQLLLPADGSELVIVIDQFEEIFTLVEDENTRSDFLNLLVTTVTDKRSRVRIVLTLRADFYDRPLNYPEFGDLLRQHMETILPLSAKSIERAIVEPAKRVHVSFEPGLIATIVSDVNYQAGALPLLQYALTELFEQKTDRHITHEAYQTIGGAVGALAKRAEAIYQELSPAMQTIARQMFLRLVTLGEGVEDTRRRTLRSELVAASGNSELLDEVIDAYANYRLLALDNDPATRAPTVEVAHEALLREWERLRGWLNESRSDIRLQRQLAAGAEEWKKSANDTSYLMTGSRLAQVEEWSKTLSLPLTPDEKTYLQASLLRRDEEIQRETERQAREQALEKRSVRFLRALVGVFAVAAVIAIGLSLFAFNESKAAQDARLISDQNADYASSIALASAANSAQVLGNPDQAIALAVAANKVTDNPPAFAQSILYDVAFAPATHRVYTGLPAENGRLDISRDGKRVLSWDASNRVVYWELASGNILYDGSPDFLQDHMMGIAVFAIDGETAFARIVSSDQISSAVIEFDVQTGQLIREFELPKGTTGLSINWWPVVLSPDGRMLVAELYETGLVAGASKTGHLYGWDVATGKLIFKSGELPSKQPYIPQWIEFSDDSQQILMSVNEGVAHLLDAQTGDYIRTYGEAATFDAPNVWAFFTPAGILTVIGDGGTYTTTASLWDVSSGEMLRQASWPDPSNWATISSDGRTMALAQAASQIALLDISTWQQTDLFGHTFAVKRASFTLNNQHLLTVSDDGTTRLWNLENESIMQRLEGGNSFFSSLIISPDGQTAVSQEYLEFDKGRLLLWDLHTGNIIRTVAMNEELVGGVAFSPDSKTILSASIPNARICDVAQTTIHLTEVATGKMLWEVTKDRGSIFGGATFTQDGSRILTVDWACENVVTVWDSATGEKLATWDGHDAPLWTIDASMDGNWVVSGSLDGKALLRDASAGAVVREFVHESNVSAVRFSPDSQILLTAEQSGVLHLWDIATGQELRQFTRHSSYVLFMEFSPNGRYVVSSSGADGNIFVWDVETGDAIRQFHLPVVSPIGSVVAFSPDSQSIYFSDEKNVIRQLDLMLEPGKLLDWISKNRYVRDLTCGERELYRVEPLCEAGS